jgi:hypothetical protein
MERAYMPPAEPPQLEDDTWAHPSQSCGSGAPARTAGFDPFRTLGRRMKSSFLLNADGISSYNALNISRQPAGCALAW